MHARNPYGQTVIYERITIISKLLGKSSQNMFKKPESAVKVAFNENCLY
jgi:hypothetical protein